MKTINLKKGKLLNGKLIEEKCTVCRQKSVLKYQPKRRHLTLGSQREEYLSAVTAIWHLMDVAEHRDTF
jgi:hypothetical protein